MIKMVVFDMAGTVIDENNVVYKTLLEVINAEGYNISLEQVLTEGAGKEKFQAIKDILKKYKGVDNSEIIERVYQTFQHKLTSAYDTMDIKAQRGAEKLFEELKQNKIFVVLNTGYNYNTAQSILKKVGWEVGQQIDSMITASDVRNNRPQPDMINLAKNKFGLSSSDQVVKIGDSAIDIEEGRNADCALCIGITTGAQTRAQLLAANPDFVVDSLDEVLKILLKS